MKPLQSIARLLVLAFCFAWVMCSCSTVTTTTITTDKAGTVTETTTVTKSSDAGALALAGQIATAYAPRGIIIREEKADPDIRRLLRGWQGRTAVALTGPITPEEIAARWKP
jgi:uncharacterized protein YceK